MLVSKVLTKGELTITLESRDNYYGLKCLYIYIHNNEHNCAFNYTPGFESDYNNLSMPHCWSAVLPDYFMYGTRNVTQCALCAVTTIEALYNHVCDQQPKVLHTRVRYPFRLHSSPPP